MDGLFIMENPIKVDALGVSKFQETPIWFPIFRGATHGNWMHPTGEFIHLPMHTMNRNSRWGG